TKEITGQFLETPRGHVALFAWSDPQQSYPHDALKVAARDVRGFVIRASAVDSPAAYQLYDLERGGSVSLAVRRRAPTQMTLAPRRVLRPGRYELIAAKEGMFGGRDYDYLRVVPAASSVSAISRETTRTAPTVAAALPPVAAALVALLFAWLLLTSFVRRPAGQKALWG